MSVTWNDAPPPPPKPLTIGARWRVLWRGSLIVLIIGLGLLVKALIRLVERPLFRTHRPLSPAITVAVCRLVLRVMALPVTTEGRLLTGRGALVANHTSWLDIFVLNSLSGLYFVSKAEVAGWPGIGLLAKVTGTLFISRDRRAAAEQTEMLQDRLLHGHRLLFFPEGTSTDGQRVLPFKTTLFAAFFDARLLHALEIQSWSVSYRAPKGESARFYGWWGDMAFAPGLLQVLAQRPQGRVHVVFHPPLRVDDYANRKSLAQALEEQVRDGHKPSRRVRTLPPETP